MYPLNLPPLQILHLSSQLLWAGLILLLVGLMAAYGLEKHLNVPTLVLAHSLTLIGHRTGRLRAASDRSGAPERQACAHAIA